jgi:hypothetical protein
MAVFATDAVRKYLNNILYAEAKAKLRVVSAYPTKGDIEDVEALIGKMLGDARTSGLRTDLDTASAKLQNRSLGREGGR